MKKRILSGAILIGLLIAVFGWPPFGGEPTANYAEAADGFISEVRRLPNGIYEVSALTPMPGVTPEMVRWWFADYMQTTAHYQRWHPTAHLWMDWENKSPGEYVDASHLVHEYIGENLSKLRIQFVAAQTILGDLQLRPADVAVCALPGLLEQPLYVGKMCHIVRATEQGAEMRSRFWLGIVAKRNGNNSVGSLEGLIGNTYLARRIAVSDRDAFALMNHAIQEMGYLADFLAELYTTEMADAAANIEAQVTE